MSAFLVTVRTYNAIYQYSALAHSSFDAHAAAIDAFGAASVSVKAEVQTSAHPGE